MVTALLILSGTRSLIVHTAQRGRRQQQPERHAPAQHEAIQPGRGAGQLACHGQSPQPAPVPAVAAEPEAADRCGRRPAEGARAFARRHPAHGGVGGVGARREGGHQHPQGERGPRKAPLQRQRPGTPQLFATCPPSLILSDIWAGSQVWAKVKGSPWWPALVCADASGEVLRGRRYHVVFYGDDAMEGYCNESNMAEFEFNLHNFSAEAPEKWRRKRQAALEDALVELQARQHSVASLTATRSTGGLRKRAKLESEQGSSEEDESSDDDGDTQSGSEVLELLTQAALEIEQESEDTAGNTGKTSDFVTPHDRSPPRSSPASEDGRQTPPVMETGIEDLVAIMMMDKEPAPAAPTQQQQQKKEKKKRKRAPKKKKHDTNFGGFSGLHGQPKKEPETQPLKKKRSVGQNHGRPQASLLPTSAFQSFVRPQLHQPLVAPKYASVQLPVAPQYASVQLPVAPQYASGSRWFANPSSASYPSVSVVVPATRATIPAAPVAPFAGSWQLPGPNPQARVPAVPEVLPFQQHPLHWRELERADTRNVFELAVDDMDQEETIDLTAGEEPSPQLPQQRQPQPRQPQKMALMSILC